MTDDAWKRIVWHQFGAAIDMLDNAALACPDRLWERQLWVEEGDPPGFSQFWYLAFHAAFWLDFYLSPTRDDFEPPPPFTLGELDPEGVLPERTYTVTEVRKYLAHGRAKCQTTIEQLTAPTAERRCQFPWGEVSFAELLLYNMRHVQEHAAQLNLFLGQNQEMASR